MRLLVPEAWPDPCHIPEQFTVRLRVQGPALPLTRPMNFTSLCVLICKMGTPPLLGQRMKRGQAGDRDRRCWGYLREHHSIPTATEGRFPAPGLRGDLNSGSVPTEWHPTSKGRASRERRLGGEAFSLLGACEGIKSFHKYTAGHPPALPPNQSSIHPSIHPEPVPRVGQRTQGGCGLDRQGHSRRWGRKPQGLPV